MNRSLPLALLAAGTLASGHLAAAPQGPQPPNVSMQLGYFFERVISGFDFPTAIAFNEQKLWITEAGFMPQFPPKVRQINLANNQVTTILSASDLPEGKLKGPLLDVTFHEGKLWIAHRQTGANGWAVGAISRFDPANPVASFETVVKNLPSSGDHHTNEIVFSASGRAYIALGTATNSAVVGPDNWILEQWLQSYPTFHDFAPV